MGEKKTMTLNLSEEEMSSLEELATAKRHEQDRAYQEGHSHLSYPGDENAKGESTYSWKTLFTRERPSCCLYE